MLSIFLGVQKGTTKVLSTLLRFLRCAIDAHSTFLKV